MEEFSNFYDGELTMGPLNRALLEWEAFYNGRRPHQSLGWLSPMEYLAGRRLEDASVSYATNERRLLRTAPRWCRLALPERGAGAGALGIYGSRQARDIAREYRVNERIRVPQVRVIDERGEQFGVMAVADALALAREHDLDLVEVAPNSDPPVCRLLDYGKFRYLQSTKEREMRKSHKNVGLREVRFRPRIGRHDIEAKERLVLKLLGEGNKVKVSVMHRGRELDHRELSIALLKQVHEAVKDEAKLELAPKQEGRLISIVLAPEKAAPARREPDPRKNEETETDA